MCDTLTSVTNWITPYRIV